VPLHAAAARGFEAGADAYARGRPGYPDAAVDAALEALRVGPGDLLLELGAGTGSLTRSLAARGLCVLALEPVAAMRRRLAGVAGALPVAATAEALPVRDGGVAGAIAATAFHWFDGPAALRALHRALPRGARLALLWNRRDLAVDWVARLDELLNAAEPPGTPRYRTGRWRAAFDAAAGAFGPLHASQHPHVHVLSPEGVVDRIASVSYVAAMDASGRERVLAEVRALLAAHPDTAGRDALELPYVADLWWCERA
jgi:SAM-dependent methyltransferase